MQPSRSKYLGLRHSLQTLWHERRWAGVKGSICARVSIVQHVLSLPLYCPDNLQNDSLNQKVLQWGATQAAPVVSCCFLVGVSLLLALTPPPAAPGRWSKAFPYRGDQLAKCG